MTKPNSYGRWGAWRLTRAIWTIWTITRTTNGLIINENETGDYEHHKKDQHWIEEMRRGKEPDLELRNRSLYQKTWQIDPI